VLEKKQRSVRLSDRTWEMLQELRKDYIDYDLSVEYIFFKSLQHFQESMTKKQARDEKRRIQFEQNKKHKCFHCEHIIKKSEFNECRKCNKNTCIKCNGCGCVND